MDRRTLEEHCARLGVSPPSFHALLMSSPAVTRFGRSIYGLVGSQADRR